MGEHFSLAMSLAPINEGATTQQQELSDLIVEARQQMEQSRTRKCKAFPRYRRGWFADFVAAEHPTVVQELMEVEHTAAWPMITHSACYWQQPSAGCEAAPEPGSRWSYDDRQLLAESM